MHFKRCRAHKTVEMCIEPSRQSRKQGRNHKGRQTGEKGIDPEAFHQQIAATQGTHGAARTGVEQIARGQQGQQHNRPDQIEHLPAGHQFERSEADRWHIGDAVIIA